MLTHTVYVSEDVYKAKERIEWTIGPINMVWSLAPKATVGLPNGEIYSHSGSLTSNRRQFWQIQTSWAMMN